MTDRPWLVHYPPGVPAEIQPGAYSSLTDLLDVKFSEYAARPAFTNRGTTLTFREVDELCRAFGGYLHSRGYGRGDRIAVMLPNLLQTPIVVFGILRAGMVVVNVNPMYTARELRDQLCDSGAKAIVVLETFADALSEVVADTELVEVIVTSVGDQHGLAKRWLIDFVVRYVKRLVPRTRLSRAVSYRGALAQGRDSSFEPVRCTADDVAFLQYTGGTTGVSKGAVLSHGNVASNVAQICAWARPFFDPNRGVVVTALPLYHIFALTVNLLGFTELGGHSLLITDPRDLRAFVAELKRYPFAFVSGVNTLFNALLHAEGFADLDFSPLQICLAGGMAVQSDVAQRWYEVTGTPISQGYGLTEASPVVTASPVNGAPFDGSVGLPLPSTDVRILDDDDREVASGSSGEICVRGPQVMKEYWRMPAETKQVLFGSGWLRTGDIGRFDERGYLYIDDRKKDVIVVSGFKVFPNEVEDVIMQHPGVREVAAVGVADPDSEQVVKVFVVKKDPDLTAEALIRYCRQYLTGYKIPHFVEFADELPKTNVGKVLRRALQGQHQ